VPLPEPRLVIFRPSGNLQPSADFWLGYAVRALRRHGYQAGGEPTARTYVLSRTAVEWMEISYASAPDL
jgi:hypothetical protein